MEIQVVKNILEANDILARQVREALRASGVTAVNVMGTPGAGKTSLISRTITSLGDSVPTAVIEGDIATSLDAEMLSALGVPVVQINTGSECHLDAGMIKTAISQMDLSGLDLLLIENVGNLVCPAEFDLGEAERIVITSVAEGDDKVQKYPLMFRLADAVVLNKIDLAPYVSYDFDKFLSSLSELNPQAAVFQVSCTTGENIESWVEWLRSCVSRESYVR